MSEREIPVWESHLLGATSSHLVVISQGPSLPVSQPEKCLSHRVTLRWDQVPKPLLWVSREAAPLGQMCAMRRRAAGLWHTDRVPVAVASREGVSRICIASLRFPCQETCPVDVPAAVALGGDGVRAERLFHTGKEQLRQLPSVQRLC